jgi:hypothetical protein
MAPTVIKMKVICLLSREELGRMPADRQAGLAYDAFGHVADRLVEMGFAPDLVATAASDLGCELVALDGSPSCVFRARKGG